MTDGAAECRRIVVDDALGPHARAARVASSASGQRCAYVSSVVVADACPRCFCTALTLAPLAISTEAQ